MKGSDDINHSEKRDNKTRLDELSNMYNNLIYSLKNIKNISELNLSNNEELKILETEATEINKFIEEEKKKPIIENQNNKNQPQLDPLLAKIYSWSVKYDTYEEKFYTIVQGNLDLLKNMDMPDLTAQINDLNESITLFNQYVMQLSKLEVDSVERNKDTIASLKEKMNTLDKKIVELKLKLKDPLQTFQIIKRAVTKSRSWVNMIHEFTNEINILKKIPESYEENYRKIKTAFLKPENEEDEDLKKKIWDEEIKVALENYDSSIDEGNKTIDEKDKVMVMYKDITKANYDIPIKTYKVNNSDDETINLYQLNKQNINNPLLVAISNAMMSYYEIDDVDISDIDSKFAISFKNAFGKDLYIIKDDQLLINKDAIDEIEKNYSPLDVVKFVNLLFEELKNKRVGLAGFFNPFSSDKDKPSRSEKALIEEIQAVFENDSVLKSVFSFENKNDQPIVKVNNLEKLEPPPVNAVEDISSKVKLLNSFIAGVKSLSEKIKDNASKIKESGKILIETADNIQKHYKELKECYQELKKSWEEKEFKPSVETRKELEVGSMTNEEIHKKISFLIEETKEGLINDSKGKGKASASFSTYASLFSPINNTKYINALDQLKSEFNNNTEEINLKNIYENIDKIILDSGDSKHKHIQNVFLSLKLNLQYIDELAKKRPGAARIGSELEVQDIKKNNV